MVHHHTAANCFFFFNLHNFLSTHRMKKTYWEELKRINRGFKWRPIKRSLHQTTLCLFLPTVSLRSTFARKHKDAAKLSLLCRLLDSHSRRANPSPEYCRTIEAGQSAAACSSSSSSKSRFLPVKHEKFWFPSCNIANQRKSRISVSTSVEVVTGTWSLKKINKIFLF